MPSEGVTKFSASHTECRLEPRVFGERACDLIAWREIMAMTGLVGRDPHRYDGAAYGNVSARVGPPSSPKGKRAMLVSGTQTGDRRDLSLDDFCLVSEYDIDANRVVSRGTIAPSSESMTHGAIYDCSPSIRVVLHAHSPIVWAARRALRIPETPESVEYGTPEMASEVRRLFRDTSLPERQILAMAGHLDGIVVFGKNTNEAGVTLLTALSSAYRECCRTSAFRR